MRAFTLLLIGYASVASAAGAADQKEIARQRQETLDAILSSDESEVVARRRWTCFNGREPARVRQAWAEGWDFTPEAFDSCVAALRRKGKDHALLDAYKKLTANLGGNVGTYEKLPKAIGSAVLGGDGTVALGNGRGVKVDSALAFDAGFTVAYTVGAAKKEGLDSQKLRLFAQDCLDQKNDAATCFSAGYSLGAEAISAR